MTKKKEEKKFSTIIMAKAVTSLQVEVRTRETRLLVRHAQLYANNINKYWHYLSTLMGLQAARSYYKCYHGNIIILRQQNKV